LLPHGCARAVAPPTERGSLENHQRRGSFVSSRFASLVLRLGYAAPARRERQPHQICRLPNYRQERRGVPGQLQKTMKTGSFATDPERPSRRGEPTRAGGTRIVAHSISDVPTLRYRCRRPAIDVCHAKFIEIDGKRFPVAGHAGKTARATRACCREKTRPSRRAPTSMEAISEGQLADSSISSYRPRRSRIFPARPKLPFCLPRVCPGFALRQASTSPERRSPTKGQVADRNGHAALTIGRSIVPR